LRFRGRISPDDLWAFRCALDAATPRVVVTPVLILACVAVFAATTFSGVPVFWPSGSQLLEWGANDRTRVVLRQDYWRLATMAFVHGGLIHLILNMWSLGVIGPLVERIYGHLAFTVLYLGAGVGGAIASAAMPSDRVSVGASGALCGVLGALLAFLLLRRRWIPRSILRTLSTSGLGIAAFMAVLSALVPNIDHAAHLGGLGTGFVSGLMLCRPWPAAAGRRNRKGRLAVIALIAVSLAGIAIAVVHHGETTLAPATRFADLAEQLAPAITEFNAIRQTLASIGTPSDDSRARKQTDELLVGLSVRGDANLARFHRVRTPDLELQVVVDDLVQIQAWQIRRLGALRRFLEAGDRKNLSGPGGALAAKAETARAIHEFEHHRDNYLVKHGLIGGPLQPEL
jgi:rhomboid protease GluP